MRTGEEIRYSGVTINKDMEMKTHIKYRKDVRRTAGGKIRVIVCDLSPCRLLRSGSKNMNDSILGIFYR